MFTPHKQSLKSLNTFGFDVFSENYIEIQSDNDLIELHAQGILKSGFRVLGGGSNILFTENIQSLLLKNSIKGRTIQNISNEFVEISFGGGENWHESVIYCVNEGWGGLENLSLIPGSVGACPIQNIGAYGVEIKDSFNWLKAFNIESGEFEIFDNKQCQFGYRDSYFKREGKNKYIITEVCFRLSLNPTLNLEYGDIRAVIEQKGITQPTIKSVSDAVIEIRSSKLPDPKLLGNCGSFFKNPVIPMDQFTELKDRFPSIKSFPISNDWVKIPAGWLIETAGWKGKKVGSVGVHEKQSLVLVHFGGGTGLDVKNLAFSIIDDIQSKFGIQLEIEVNIW